MKTKIILIILVVICLISQSCTKLEDRNYHQIIADQFDPSAEDIAALLASAYIPIRQTQLLWNGVVRAQMLTTDQDVIPKRPNGWVDGGDYVRMHQHTWTAEDELVNNCWERTYVGINACNKLLYQLEEEIELDEERNNAFVAELKVLRAYYYYILVDLYGNVPLITQFDVEDGYLPEQISRRDLYDFIITEITENIGYLTESKSLEYYGRFNKWAGYSLLAKMSLNTEVFTNGRDAEWAKCIAACDSVIQKGGYQLEDEQWKVFRTENENSPEIIMALAFDEVYIDDWNAFDFHLYTLQAGNQATYNFMHAPWGGVCCIPQYIDTFDPDDIRLQNCFIQGQQYTSTGDMLYSEQGAEKGEPLSYVNLLHNISFSTENHGFRWGKFEYAMGITNRLSNDWPLFRYADILLMKAEALLRNGQADDAAVLVTEVRERNFRNNPSKAFVSGGDLIQGSTYAYGLKYDILDVVLDPVTEEEIGFEVVQEIRTYEGGSDIQYGRLLDELGWEFTQEGRRRQDMIRFGAFTTKSWFNHDAKDSDATRNLFPIPQRQLLNNSKLTQNDGY